MGLVILDSEIPQCSNPLMQMTETLNPLYMKKLIALILIVASIYFVVADGLMTHFNLSQSCQYAFNFGCIFLVIPTSLFILLGMQFEEEKQ